MTLWVEEWKTLIESHHLATSGRDITYLMLRDLMWLRALTVLKGTPRYM